MVRTGICTAMFQGLFQDYDHCLLCMFGPPGLWPLFMMHIPGPPGLWPVYDACFSSSIMTIVYYTCFRASWIKTLLYMFQGLLLDYDLCLLCMFQGLLLDYLRCCSYQRLELWLRQGAFSYFLALPMDYVLCLLCMFQGLLLHYPPCCSDQRLELWLRQRAFSYSLALILQYDLCLLCMFQGLLLDYDLCLLCMFQGLLLDYLPCCSDQRLELWLRQRTHHVSYPRALLPADLQASLQDLLQVCLQISEYHLHDYLQDHQVCAPLYIVYRIYSLTLLWWFTVNIIC